MHQSYCSIFDYITYAVHLSLWLIYFITGSLYLLIPFTHFADPWTLLPSGNPKFVLCICKSISVLFYFFVCFVF